jgi:hypothetical protein
MIHICGEEHTKCNRQSNGTQMINRGEGFLSDLLDWIIKHQEKTIV